MQLKQSREDVGKADTCRFEVRTWPHSPFTQAASGPRLLRLLFPIPGKLSGSPAPRPAKKDGEDHHSLRLEPPAVVENLVWLASTPSPSGPKKPADYTYVTSRKQLSVCA